MEIGSTTYCVPLPFVRGLYEGQRRYVGIHRGVEGLGSISPKTNGRPKGARFFARGGTMLVAGKGKQPQIPDFHTPPHTVDQMPSIAK